jgi:hypothetical protein
MILIGKYSISNKPKIKESSPNAVKIQREYCYVYHPEKNAPIIDV